MHGLTELNILSLTKDETKETSLAWSYTEDSGPHHPVTRLETFSDHATVPH